MPGNVWRGVLPAAILVVFALPGFAAAHLDPGGPPHLDIEAGPYVAGEPLEIRLHVSNPGTEHADYIWYNGCVTVGHIESERRVLASWSYDASTICTQQIVGLSVPPNTSLLWRTFALETRADDGCIRIWISLRGYPVDGSTEVCPGSPEPAPQVMALAVSAPPAAIAGDRIEIAVRVRAEDGQAIEGIRVEASVGAKSAGFAFTGPDGRAVLAAHAPEVSEITDLPLTVRASGEGWQSASRVEAITIFPPIVRYLTLRPIVPMGDIVSSEDVTTVQFIVEGSDGGSPVDATLEIETSGPLALEAIHQVGPNRFHVTMRAAAVNIGQIASLRAVANAPGYEGTETVVDFYVSARTSSLPDTPQASDPPSPLGRTSATLGLISIALVSLAAVVRQLRRRRRA